MHSHVQHYAKYSRCTYTYMDLHVLLLKYMPYNFLSQNQINFLPTVYWKLAHEGIPYTSHWYIDTGQLYSMIVCGFTIFLR